MSPGVPPVAGRLIDELIRDQGNVGGAVRNAPHSLRELKKSLEGVPFQLLAPGMAGVMSGLNLNSMISRLAQMAGLDLSVLGKFQPIIGALARGQADPTAIVQAMGAGAGLGAALMSYGGAIDAVQAVSQSPPGTSSTASGTVTAGSSQETGAVGTPGATVA